jgi:DNA-directed RNA polymerase II subunit RPB2
MEFLEEWGLEDTAEYSNAPSATKVFVNGVWMGIHRDAVTLHQNLLQMRRGGQLKHEVSIVRDIRERELRLFTDAGRVCRPLFIVDQENQSIYLKREHIDHMDDITEGVVEAENGSGWDELLSQGIIEYVDAEEEETILIAMGSEDLDNARIYHSREEVERAHAAHNIEAFDPAARIKSSNWSQNYTHMEIHPSMILGVCASIVPFPDHNQVRTSFTFSANSSLLVTRISRPWASRPWASTSQITSCEWTQWPTFSTTRNLLWPQRKQCATSSLPSCLLARTRSLPFCVTRVTTRKTRLL